MGNIFKWSLNSFRWCDAWSDTIISQNGTGVQIQSRLIALLPYWLRSSNMDDRTRSHFLSLTAFSAVAQCADWIVSHMASQLQDEPKVKKPRASWSHDEEVAFLDYLVEHQSEATHGCFKDSTISGAINSTAHLHVRGPIKNRTNRTNKWNSVSIFLPFLYWFYWSFVFSGNQPILQFKNTRH